MIPVQNHLVSVDLSSIPMKQAELKCDWVKEEGNGRTTCKVAMVIIVMMIIHLKMLILNSSWESGKYYQFGHEESCAQS